MMNLQYPYRLAVTFFIGGLIGLFSFGSLYAEEPQSTKPFINLDEKLLVDSNKTLPSDILLEANWFDGNGVLRIRAGRQVDYLKGTTAKWESLGALPKQLTAPKFTPSRNGFFVLDGSVSEGKQAVYYLTKDENNKKALTLLELPPLPEVRLGAGIGVMDYKHKPRSYSFYREKKKKKKKGEAFPLDVMEAKEEFFVIGGQSSIGGSDPSNSVYRLSLDDPKKGVKREWRWTKEEDFPGEAVSNPLVVAQSEELFLFGGAKQDQTASHQVWRYRYHPGDGIRNLGWESCPDSPQGLIGAATAATGQTHILLMGGADQIGGTPSTKVNSFHCLTRTWVAVGERFAGAPENLAYFFTGKEFKVSVKDTNVYRILAYEKQGQIQFSRWMMQKSVKSLSVLDYGVILLYFLAMAGIGVYFARKQNSAEEFAVGSRKVKWWAASLSFFATAASSISFMAVPAQAYGSSMIWTASAVFLIGGFLLQAYLMFPLLRRLKLTSTYAYLESRFHPAVRYVASVQFILFQLLGRMSVVLLLPSIAIHAVTGLDIFTAVAIMGILTTIYTAFGGFEAVIWTDVVQGVMMLGGLILMIVVALGAMDGGFSEYLEVGGEYDRTRLFYFDGDWTQPIIWVFLVQTIVNQAAFASDQTQAQRVFATPMKEVRKLAFGFMVCSVVISLTVGFLGTLLFTFFHANPTDLSPDMKTDAVVPLFMIQRLPVGIAGLIIACLFAASMSTVSSGMNSVAVVISEDFFKRFRPKASDRELLFCMKFTSIIAGVIGTGTALYMASMNLTSMFETFSRVVSLLGGGFIGIYILGMFTTRANTAGVVCGAVAAVLASLYMQFFSNITFLMHLPISVASCVTVGYLSSWILPFGKAKDLAGLTLFTMLPESGEK